MIGAVEIGATFPQTRFGADPAAVREFALTAEQLGYTHLLAYDHVLGASHEGRDLGGPYTEHDPFHEPLVLFGYLAAITTRIELVTAVLVLPQRQAALVAKQAAEVALLSGGRLRLGVGVGWNRVEYESLNEDFRGRGARCEEQVELMRRLWSEPLVEFEGRWHRVDRASILPRPAAPIPVWFGGFSDAALRRAARLGDGFVFPRFDERVREQVDLLRRYLDEAGRDERGFGMETFVEYGAGRDDWARRLEACRAAGMTHVAMRTIGSDFSTPQEHIEALRSFAAFAGIAAG